MTGQLPGLGGEPVDVEEAFGFDPVPEKQAQRERLRRARPRLTNEEWRKLSEIIRPISDRYEGKPWSDKVASEMMKEVNGRLRAAGYGYGLGFEWRVPGMTSYIDMAERRPPDVMDVEISPYVTIDVDDLDRKLALMEEAVAESERNREDGREYFGGGDKMFGDKIFQNDKVAAATARPALAAKRRRHGRRPGGRRNKKGR